MGFFRLWTHQLVQGGLSHFFDDPTAKLSPGAMYSFWIMGLVKQVLQPGLSFGDHAFDFYLKLPGNVADLAIGVLIYLLARRHAGPRWAMAGFLLWALNPAAIFNTSVWGQNDALATLFPVAGVYLRATGGGATLLWAAAAFAAGAVVKPQHVAMALPFAAHAASTTGRRGLLLAILAAGLTVLLLYLPYFPANPIAGIVAVNRGSAGLFDCTTCFAANLWGIFAQYQPDAATYLGIPYWLIGLGLTAAAFAALLLLRPISPRYRFPAWCLTLALYVLAAYMLLTRVHERYLFPALPLMLLGALALRSLRLVAVYAALSLLHTVNLWLVYDYQTGRFASPLGSYLFDHFNALSALTAACVVALVVLYIRPLRVLRPVPARTQGRRRRRRGRR